jgi:hypothetical protein
MRLTRTVQCKKCPWKKSTDPNTIPDGYSCLLHGALKNTIAEPGSLRQTPAMACHQSAIGKETYCIGWLYNQLGVGNNIHLRFRIRQFANLKDIRIVGEQHQTFEETLPK